MRAVLRQLVLLALSALASWWLFLRVPPAPVLPRAVPVPPAALDVVPVIEAAAAAPMPAGASPAESISEATAAAPSPAESSEPRELVAEFHRAPEADAPPLPPPEAGAPEGDEPPGRVPARSELARDETAVEPEPSAPEPSPAEEPPATEDEPVEAVAAETLAAEPAPEDAPPDSRAPAAAVASAMRDPRLLAEARSEFERGHRKGFATVLLAAPEQQLAIARFFGEELVLVPSRALDPSGADARWFRLGRGERVESLEGAPPLERHRQYRDLFDYDYARLPPALRELRRSVPARGEVYLFAALLSPEEWALVIARRGEALALAGRELADVRRFVLRYVERPGGAFDMLVDEIGFADGTRFRPAEHVER